MIPEGSASELPSEPDGFLLLLRRTFDSEPLAFFAGRDEAEREARRLMAAYDPMAPARGQPETEGGCLGPPGIVSRVIGIVLIPCHGGRMSTMGRRFFVPEEVAHADA